MPKKAKETRPDGGAILVRVTQDQRDRIEKALAVLGARLGTVPVKIPIGGFLLDAALKAAEALLEDDGNRDAIGDFGGGTGTSRSRLRTTMPPSSVGSSKKY